MEQTNKPSKAGKPAKLTRQQIKEGLDQIPIEVLLSSGQGKKPALTHKQKEFARAIAMGSTKAQAYRDTYNTKGSVTTQGNNASRLAADSRIKAEVEAYKLALEAEKHRTPAQLKALLVQQLVQHSLDEEFPPAQRVKCLHLLGQLFEVGAFVERKEIVTVNKSQDIRARLLQVLGSDAIDVDAKPARPADDDGAASLLEELQAVPVENVETLDPTAGEAPESGPMRRDSTTHTIPHTQSTEKSDDFDSP